MRRRIRDNEQVAIRREAGQRGERGRGGRRNRRRGVDADGTRDGKAIRRRGRQQRARLILNGERVAARAESGKMRQGGRGRGGGGGDRVGGKCRTDEGQQRSGRHGI